MKVNKVIIISIIINFLLAGVIYNFIKKDYLNNERIIVKAMTETEYEDNITELNQSHTDYANYIEASKEQIASAITDMGVTTTKEATPETMSSNIRSIARNAYSIEYDNTGSGLTSTNVQGAVDELNDSLTNENNESFNFGVKDGVRGFYTDPSRADDSFIPFKSGTTIPAIFLLSTTSTSTTKAPFFFLDNDIFEINENILTCKKDIKNLKIILNRKVLGVNRVFYTKVYHNSSKIYDDYGSNKSNFENAEITLDVSVGDTIYLTLYGEDNNYTSVRTNIYGYFYY